MCGRYRIKRLDLLTLGIRFETAGFEEFTEKPRWNVAPSQRLPIIRTSADGKFVVAQATWGFIPGWTKGTPKLKPINAKAETVASSGMFRQAFERRRALVPADGFYEWQGAKPPKQPFFIHRRDDGLFAFAGLWERWRADETSEPVDTFTIITTTPNDLMAPIHNRMPVIVAPGDYQRWLDNSTPTEALKEMLKPISPGDFEAYPVSTRVNSPGNDEPGCSERENELWK
jgi:putative SOS response-associated peptidase YedK